MLQFECTSGLPNGFAPTNLVYSYVFVQTHKLTKEVGYKDILILQRGRIWVHWLNLFYSHLKRYPFLPINYRFMAESVSKVQEGLGVTSVKRMDVLVGCAVNVHVGWFVLRTHQASCFQNPGPRTRFRCKGGNASVTGGCKRHVYWYQCGLLFLHWSRPLHPFDCNNVLEPFR